MELTLHITTCPVCDNQHIKRVTRDWVGTFQGETYTVPSLEFYECPECGEKIYDRHAMQKIETFSPAFDKTRSKKTSQKSKKAKTNPKSPALAKLA